MTRMSLFNWKRSRPFHLAMDNSNSISQRFDQLKLENFIQDWYYDETSHEFARQVGTFLFKFLDDLEASGLTRRTLLKHKENCWCIGKLECDYGYRNTFAPDIFLTGPAYLYEFKRKMSDSKYAVASYQATWRKLERYVRSLEYDSSE